MAEQKNILFIMFDQLRFDYLSCSGHPYLHTPHLDWLASQSVRFDKCFVQSPVCGASRMSFYTGRYVSSHGAAWNGIPLKVGEMTLGDHLRDAQMDSYLIGKTHMRVDKKGMARLGLVADSIIGARVSECGFDPVIRDDGLWADGPDGVYDPSPSAYNAYLRARGYDGHNPWHDYANAGIDDDGNIASAWLYENASRPANIREEDSETPWLTRQAIDFMKQKQAQSSNGWLCHLSYIKPHWPYIVPSPYHDMYQPDHFLPANRHARELENPHPIYAAFAHNIIGKAFHRDSVRHAVLGAYMGLIKQIDDHMGVLFAYLKSSGLMENTMIVVTSDHGDYLGDHWLGEKDLFHDPSVRVPLIIYDPTAAADKTRGQTNPALVEAVDLAATFIDFCGAAVPDEVIEGRSLLPFIYDQPIQNWRSFAVSEYDYSKTMMAEQLNLAPKDARLFMIADDGFKFIHAEGGFAPMLFDLSNDPMELDDRGRDPKFRGVINEYYDRLFSWTRRCNQRTTVSDADLKAQRFDADRVGILLGIENKQDIDPELLVKYQGPAGQNYLNSKD